MFKRSAISAAALVTIGVIAAAPAFAQEVQEKLERVEVTGSRLKTIGNTSSSPITSVGKEDINTTQPVAVEELVRGLPSSYPAIGPAMNNGSTGIASIDLRGLGSNRTLVLFNGKRFVPANLGGVVDTNNVPVSLLERVDLVTGGASAVYGADAVSGVVNFVTKRNFTGVEATTLYSISEKGDAGRRKNDITMGANLADGRGNVALHIGTTKTDPLRLADRDYSQIVISSASGKPGGFSGTAAPSQFSGMPGAISGSQVIDATTGLFRPIGGTEDAYNTNPPNYFETPLTRTQATALGHFRINDNAEAYAELFHTRSNVTLNLAPSGTFGAGFNVPIGNPFITDKVRGQICAAYLADELAKKPADQSATLIAGLQPDKCVAGSATEVRMAVARRFVEAGPRIYSYDNTTTQYTAGLRGDIPFLDSWSYDAYYQSGRSDQTVRTGNGFSSSKTQQALRATSATKCTVTTGGCVPLNVFGASGSITPEMLAFISTPTFQTTRVEQQVTSVSANGEVAFAKSPWARAPLGLALGMERRSVFGANASDAVVQTQGELLGSGAPTPDRSGKLNFTETYMEASLPLLQNLPLVQSLNLGAGYRETKLSTSTGESQSYGSWKGGLDWTPMKGLRFRGERQRATRAPNINELYAPVTTGLSTLAKDPCQGAEINAADAGKAGTLTNVCQLTGVPVAQIGKVAAPSSSQINNTGGGNPSLGPEKANTTTLGVVWEPAFVDNLSLNLDYWRIKIAEGVSSATAGQVINGCYSATLNPGLTNNVFCQAIQRDPLNGGLNGTGSKGVVTQSSNLGAYDFSGVDIGGSYRLNLKSLGAPKMGRIDFTLQLSLLNKADFKSLPSVATLEQAGYYGTDVGTPYAKTRFSQRATWTFGDYSLGYNWRYIGESEIQKDKAAANQAEYTKLKAVSYVDLNGSWQAMKNVKLSLTVNNLFDKQPPFTATGVGPGASNYGNTFPGVYDVIGRRFTFSAQAAF
ncbi:TonB-dependent receptor domain-containing protein [Roseateles sp.]|uniref:TonB-dependent receptor domain-containing protein n=1 Tax=Roseateles sp. TaxID=1971397 RepID=UPI003D09C6B5